MSLTLTSKTGPQKHWFAAKQLLVNRAAPQHAE